MKGNQMNLRLLLWNFLVCFLKQLLLVNLRNIEVHWKRSSNIRKWDGKSFAIHLYLLEKFKSWKVGVLFSAGVDFLIINIQNTFGQNINSESIYYFHMKFQLCQMVLSHHNFTIELDQFEINNDLFIYLLVAQMFFPQWIWSWVRVSCELAVTNIMKLRYCGTWFICQCNREQITIHWFGSIERNWTQDTCRIIFEAIIRLQREICTTQSYSKVLKNISMNW